MNSYELLNDQALCRTKGVLLKHLERLFFLNSKGYNGLSKITILKGFLTIVGSLAGIPYMSPAKKYGNNDLILSYTYVIGAVVPYGVLSVWSLFNYTEYFQQDIYSKHKGKSYVLTLTILPLILAFCAALPGTIISLRYNNNIFYSLVAFLNDFITESCSYNILFRRASNKIIEKYKKTTYITVIKEKLINRLKFGIRVIINETPENEVGFLQKNHLDKFFLEDPNVYINTLEIIHNLIAKGKMTASKKNPPVYLYLIFSYISNILSMILPLVWAMTVFKLAKGEVQKETSAIIGWIVAAISAISIYFLEVYLTNAVFYKTYNRISDFFNNGPSQNLAARHYYKLMLTLEIFGLTVSCFSFAAKAEVVKNSYKKEYQNITLSLITISTILFATSAILDFIPRFMNSIIEKYGPPSKKCLTKLIQLIDGFSVALESSSVEDFIEFLEDLDVDKLINENEEDIDFCDALKLYQNMQIRTNLSNNLLCNHSQFTHTQEKNKESSGVFDEECSNVETTYLPIHV